MSVFFVVVSFCCCHFRQCCVGDEDKLSERIVTPSGVAPKVAFMFKCVLYSEDSVHNSTHNSTHNSVITVHITVHITVS